MGTVQLAWPSLQGTGGAESEQMGTCQKGPLDTRWGRPRKLSVLLLVGPEATQPLQGSLGREAEQLSGKHLRTVHS